MKITSIKIRNHSRIPDCTIDVRNNLILVGANGTGKSSIIRCIDLTLGKTTQQLYYSIDNSDFEDEEQPFVVEVKLEELSKDELSFFPDDFDVLDNSLTIRMEANLDKDDLTIITTRIAGGLLLGYNPKYTCPGLKSFALHFVQVTIAM